MTNDSCKTILLVDDEEFILKAIKRLLHGSQYKVLIASSAVEAIDIIRSNVVSVILSDNMMPDIQGIELLSRVKILSPDTIRILLTGHADLTVAMEAINKGEVFRFLTKPWDNKLLLGVIDEAQQRYNLIVSLKRSDENTLLSLAQTIELKDAYTRGHCDNVARYADGIARKLNLDAPILKQIKFGSWLHDCGKIGVPERILNKDGPLTEEEFALIKKHPEWGADVAIHARLSQTVVNIILYHHEKYGGNGYPVGLTGDEIPLESRIVAIADVFDALTTNRSYRKSYSFRKAAEILKDMKGNHLDPELTELFLDNLSLDQATPGELPNPL